MNRINYDEVMQKTAEEARGKKLLLHSCCAPCSSYCLEQVSASFAVTVFYYNPNLDSEEEYLKRKSEQIRFLKETALADFLDCDYSPEAFEEIARGFEGEKEGGARCARCFALRLERTARAASENGFDYFATTLTVSPLKNAGLINRIGFSAQEKYGVKYLPTDFKKRGGYLRSVELSKAYGLYRQDYCGCRYSKEQRRVGTAEHGGN